MPISNQPSSWKEKIGFPAIGVGVMIVVGAFYGWLEDLPALTSSRNELFISELIGFGCIAVGLLLTWPRTHSNNAQKRKSH